MPMRMRYSSHLQPIPYTLLSLLLLVLLLGPSPCCVGFSHENGLCWIGFADQVFLIFDSHVISCYDVSDIFCVVFVRVCFILL